MAPLNYKHLYYFWTVAHEGSIAAASKTLHLTPQTISGQLTLLEARLDKALFKKQGRGLALTDVGATVLEYADEIFELGSELTDVLRGIPVVGSSEFIIGASSALPKTIVYKILEPALRLSHEVKMLCKEGPLESLLADLAVHKVDMVLSDSPVPSNFHVKAYNHALGECGISFFAVSDIVKRYKKGFPNSLTQAPMLVPTKQNAIRSSYENWIREMEISPKIVGEFDDSALMKSFGQAGHGIFFMSSLIEQEICRNFNVKVIGRTEEIRHSFYAISAERRIKHPAVQAICDTARSTLF